MRRNNQVATAASDSAKTITSKQVPSLTKQYSPQVDQDTQTDATAQALLPQDDDCTGYSRVTPAKALAIKQLHAIGKTGQDIATAIGVHPSTVSRWLKLLETDTVKESRQLAKSQALRATMRLSDQIESNDPRVSQGAAKAITALAGVAEGSQPVQVGVQVIVGTPDQPAGPDPFITAAVNQSPQVID